MRKTRINTWLEVTGDAVDLVLDRQYRLGKEGAPKKNLGIVINLLLNEHPDIKKAKK